MHIPEYTEWICLNAGNTCNESVRILRIRRTNLKVFWNMQNAWKVKYVRSLDVFVWPITWTKNLMQVYLSGENFITLFHQKFYNSYSWFSRSNPKILGHLAQCCIVSNFNKCGNNLLKKIWSCLVASLYWMIVSLTDIWEKFLQNKKCFFWNLKFYSKKCK